MRVMGGPFVLGETIDSALSRAAPLEAKGWRHSYDMLGEGARTAADAAMFQTGWFVESLATQILVIFVIRTPGNPFRSSPSPWLAGTCVLTVLLAAAIPGSAWRQHRGCSRPPRFV